MNILKITDVMQMTKLGRSTIYSWISKNEFPSQIKLGKRASGWIEADVLNWIQNKQTNYDTNSNTKENLSS